MTGTIDPRTRVGPVHLTVRDLEGSLAFYTARLGFQTLERREGIARLGAGGRELLVLHEDAGARRARGTTGLYHFAVLVPTRRDLSIALHRLLSMRTPLTGASDHLVSEALYLDDPEGNGIEICRDRPRDEWPHERGTLRMASDPLDLDGLLAEPGGGSEPWRGLADGTTIGHVHLHVADLDAARRFYVDVMGFELMLRFGGSALFVSAGGYHHHLGLNTWAGAGAPPPPPGSLGLRHFVVRLPDRAAREKVLDRLNAAGIETERADDGVAVRDPSSNRIMLAAGEDGRRG